LIVETVSLIFSALAFVSGAISAWYWYQSTSSNPPSAAELKNYPKDGRGITPIDLWLMSVAAKNRRAAIWSAIAVSLGSASNFIGAF
jgi:hypothetical protein